MVRDNIVNRAKFVDATHKAATELKTGMGVVIENDKLSVPSSATAADVFVVDKARIPTGLNAAKTDSSDYEDDFVTVKEGELALAVKYHAGESFLTDQFDTMTVGDRAVVGTDGKWEKGTSTVTSIYVFKGTVTDNGHTLAKIEVSDTAAKNS